MRTRFFVSFLLIIMAILSVWLVGCTAGGRPSPLPGPQSTATATRLPIGRDCQNTDPNIPVNMCDVYFIMHLSMGGEADIDEIAIGRHGFVADGFAMWDGPKASERSYRLGPFFELFQVMVKFAISEQGDLLAGVVSEWAGLTEHSDLSNSSSQALGLLTASTTGDLSLRDTLLWKVVQLEYAHIKGHLAGGKGLDGDLFLINDYGETLHILHSAIILYGDDAKSGTGPGFAKWSPLGSQSSPYWGDIRRTFELAYSGKAHSFVYVGAVTANPIDASHASSKVRLKRTLGRWITERTYYLDRYPRFVEINTIADPLRRLVWSGVSIAFAGNSMIVTDAAEFPQEGANPPPDILSFPEGISMGYPYGIRGDPLAYDAYEQARAIMSNRFLTDEQKREQLRVVQRDVGQEALAKALRHIPVYDGKRKRFYTFNGYIDDLMGSEEPASSDAPIERDPLGAALRIFFDPSPETIREMMGLEK